MTVQLRAMTKFPIACFDTCEPGDGIEAIAKSDSHWFIYYSGTADWKDSNASIHCTRSPQGDFSLSDGLMSLCYAYPEDNGKSYIFDCGIQDKNHNDNIVFTHRVNYPSSGDNNLPNALWENDIFYLSLNLNTGFCQGGIKWHLKTDDDSNIFYYNLTLNINIHSSDSHLI